MRRFLFVFLALVVSFAAAAAEAPRLPAAAIASAHPLATRAGHEILSQGGNAFDAAVAVAATLAVVEPANSGLGGGGFWLLHRASDTYEVMIDGRERAPLKARAGMYLDKDGEVVPRLSLDGPLAAAIPGTPAALDYLARRYGRLPLGQSLAPAIRLAREGFPVSERFTQMAEARRAALASSPAAAAVFLDDGFPPAPGFMLKQPDLADTLERLAAKGRDGFYTGPVARRLVKGVRRAGGIWSRRDLREYSVVERTPIVGTYRGVRVVSAPPPSSGGVALVQMLNLLAPYSLDPMHRTRRDHLIIQAMKLAYRDRARHLGDPDFVTVDVARLTGGRYAAELGREIDLPKWQIPPLMPTREQGTQTTHFSIIDRDGNRAAVTLSLNTLFGSGFMPPGTGVLLNNEMDDFVAKPGVPNAYGLVGNAANAIAPGKRPLSSMTPTFLESPDAVVILGTPGGSRIISMVLLASLEFLHHRGGVRDWLALPRFHHQYLPDTVYYEPGAYAEAEVEQLGRLGHHLQAVDRPYGNMQAIVWYKNAGRVEAASDPRGEGLALAQ
ncbi:MAG TPA: gamma-glutamyltransferase [Acidiferrobacterales bacterium]